MKATNIIWDFIGADEEDTLELPAEIEIPKEIENDEDAISDYLSEVTGFCHMEFVLVD